jgi:hypothetical protein
MPTTLLAALGSLNLEAMKKLIRTQHSSSRCVRADSTISRYYSTRMLFGAKREKIVRQVEQL